MLKLFANAFPSFFSGSHCIKQDCANEKGEPTSMKYFKCIGREKHNLNHGKQGAEGNGRELVPMPDPAGGKIEKSGGGEHG